MKTRIVLVSFVLLSAFVGYKVFSTQSHPMQAAAHAHTDDWSLQTKQMLDDSRRKDGGYSHLIQEQDPFLFDTAYDVALYALAGVPVPHEEKMKEALTELQKKKPVAIQDLTALFNQNYELMAMVQEHVPIPSEYRKAVEQNLQPLQDANGLFHISKKEDLVTSLMNTEAAVQIYKSLDPSYKNDTLHATLFRLYHDQSIWNANSDYRWTVLDSAYHIEQMIGGRTYYETDEGKALQKKLEEAGAIAFAKAPKNISELINDDGLFHLLEQLGKKPVPSDAYVNYLNGTRLPDGGYSIVGAQQADPKYTARLVDMYPQDKRPSLVGLLKEIGKYQLPSGLFTARTEIPSSPVGSYQAAYVYHDLGVETPKELKGYFENPGPLNKLSSKDLLYLNKQRVQQGQKALADNLSVPFVKKDNFTFDDYYALYNRFLHQDMTREEKQQVIAYLQSCKHADGGYGFGKTTNLEQTEAILEFLQALGVKDKSPELLGYVQSLQKSDGGYGIKDQSDLIDTYEALWILDQMNKAPQHADGLQTFLDERKVKTGGYGFTKDSAVSLLEATFYGCEAQRMLDELTGK